MTASALPQPRPADDAPPAQACATVCLAGDQHYVVAAGGRRLRAVRAASCLLAPEVGDTVAWWRGEGEDGYIVAVLVRAGAGPQQWLVDGDAEIAARGGSLSLRADDSVTVNSARLAIDADELDVRARQAQGLFDTLETFGRSIVATVSTWKMIGTELSSVFDRVFQHAGQSRRVTEGIDHVSASTLDMHGKQLVSLQGENIAAGASRLVKVQGKQIHLG